MDQPHGAGGEEPEYVPKPSMGEKLEDPGSQANSQVCNQSAADTVVGEVDLCYVQFAGCMPLPAYENRNTKHILDFN